MTYKGSCHCGNVAFEVEGEITRISHQPSQRERQNARGFWVRGPETRGGVLLAR